MSLGMTYVAWNGICRLEWHMSLGMAYAAKDDIWEVLKNAKMQCGFGRAISGFMEKLLLLFLRKKRIINLVYL